MTQPLYNVRKLTVMHLANGAQPPEYRYKANNKPTEHGKRSVFRDLKQVWIHFATTTSFHGFNQFHAKWNNKYEKCFWLVIMLLALMGYAYMCFKVAVFFRSSKMETVVHDARCPIYKVPFPVVTICNNNRLNWQRYEAAKQLFIPHIKDEQTIETFDLLLGALDTLKFAQFQPFSILENRSLDELADLPLYDLFDFMTWRCEELFENCRWRYHRKNCCDIFSKRHSKNGLCWSFNSLETEDGRIKHLQDAKWPWRISGSGPNSALRINVNLKPEHFYPNATNQPGISVMITEPYVWHTDPLNIAANTITSVHLQPSINFFDNSTQVYTLEQRKCVFNDEIEDHTSSTLKGYVYMLENCQSQCHQKYMLKYCNCTIDMFFPPNIYPICDAKGLLCLARHNFYFLYTLDIGEEEFIEYNPYAMNCTCFHNCLSLNYLTTVNSDFLSEHATANRTFIVLDVHFLQENFTIYRTKAVFTWRDLIVSFGGIAGLFLGCSLISAVEMLYLCIVRIPALFISRNGGDKVALMDTAPSPNPLPYKLPNKWNSKTFKPKINVIAVKPHALSHNYEPYTLSKHWTTGYTHHYLE